MIIKMGYELFFKIRSNIRKANGELDTGYFVEDDEGFTLVFYVKEYFAKTTILKSELGKLVNPDTSDVLNKPVFFENYELDADEFKRKFLHDFVEVNSFE